MDGIKFYKHSEAKKVLGVSDGTLRSWADSGMFPSFRTPGGTRMYQLDKFLQDKGILSRPTYTETSKEKICYCRVSSHFQKDDLQRQIIFMQENFPDHKIVTDIGSGINFKRKGLRTILEQAGKGMLSEVVVAYRDRLCRFAFELIEWLLRINEVKLVVLNNVLESSEQSELAEDLLAITNVFNCRVNGKRKYVNKRDCQDKKGRSEHGEEDQAQSHTHTEEVIG